MFNQNVCISCVFLHFKGVPGIRGSPGLPGQPGVEVKNISLNLDLICVLNLALRIEYLKMVSFATSVRVHVGQMGTKASKGGLVFW